MLSQGHLIFIGETLSELRNFFDWIVLMVYWRGELGGHLNDG
jgi:hypothetical protein